MGLVSREPATARPVWPAMETRDVKPCAETSFWWLSDFGWEDHHLVFRQTGVRVRLDRHILVELGQWVVYLIVLGLAALVAALSRPSAPNVWFAPVLPRPWYLVRGS